MQKCSMNRLWELFTCTTSVTSNGGAFSNFFGICWIFMDYLKVHQWLYVSLQLWWSITLIYPKLTSAKYQQTTVSCAIWSCYHQPFTLALWLHLLVLIKSIRIILWFLTMKTYKSHKLYNLILTCHYILHFIVYDSANIYWRIPTILTNVVVFWDINENVT